jgi:hypothetical protein
MKTLLTTTALVFAMTAGANAAQIGAGPIYAPKGNYGYCWYINLGTGNITPTSQLLYAVFSNTPIPSSDSCATGSPVPIGQSCYIYPNSSPYTSLACKVAFSTSPANVRGSLELLDTSNNVLSQVELR